MINEYIQVQCLKEYYEIVGESRPISAFFPKHADFVTKMGLGSESPLDFFTGKWSCGI